VSKLLKVKEWVTVVEATAHLSSVLGEPVREVDLYQLAYDKRLVMSVRFPRSVYGRRVELAPPDDKKKRSLSGPMLHSRLNFCYAGTAVESFDGVFDLAMVGGEQDVVRGIEWAPDREISGITYQDVILRTTEGVLFCLMTRKSDGTVQPFTSPENYETSLGMPDDARLIVRTSALAALLACLTETPESRPDAVPVTTKRQPAEALHLRSEATYLTIIGALLELALGKSAAGRAHSIFDSQAAIIGALVAHYPNAPGISKTTLEAKFAAARRKLGSN
jgi:hypothetical protein